MGVNQAWNEGINMPGNLASVAAPTVMCRGYKQFWAITAIPSWCSPCVWVIAYRDSDLWCSHFRGICCLHTFPVHRPCYPGPGTNLFCPSCRSLGLPACVNYALSFLTYFCTEEGATRWPGTSVYVDGTYRSLPFEVNTTITLKSITSTSGNSGILPPQNIPR